MYVRIWNEPQCLAYVLPQRSRQGELGEIEKNIPCSNTFSQYLFKQTHTQKKKTHTHTHLSREESSLYVNYAGEPGSIVNVLPDNVSRRAWAGVASPDTPAPLTDLELRTLAAAARSAGDVLNSHFFLSFLSFLYFVFALIEVSM